MKSMKLTKTECARDEEKKAHPAKEVKVEGRGFVPGQVQIVHNEIGN